MGGRSGQSISDEGGGSFPNNGTGVSSISGGENISDAEKNELKDYADSIMKKYGINENIQIKITDKSLGGFSGGVVLSESPDKITSQIISPRVSNKKSMIAHEFTHIKQINNNELYLRDGKIIFKNNEVMSTKDYKREFKGDTRKWSREKLIKYNSLPWELEASGNERKIK